MGIAKDGVKTSGRFLGLLDRFLLQAAFNEKDSVRNFGVARAQMFFDRDSIDISLHRARTRHDRAWNALIDLHRPEAALAHPFVLHSAEESESIPRAKLGVGIENMRVLVENDAFRRIEF